MGALERWGPVVGLTALAFWLAQRGGGPPQAAALPSPTKGSAVPKWPVPPPPALDRGGDTSEIMEWAFPYLGGIAKVSRDNPALADYIPAAQEFINRMTNRAEMEAYYTPNTLRKVAITAAGYQAIPAEWLWALLWQASRLNPSQTWFKNSPAEAVAKNTSSLGIGQETRTQHDKAKSWGEIHRLGPHLYSVVPHMAIWRMAETLRHAAEKVNRVLHPDEVNAVWSGREPSQAQAGEGKYILKQGPKVYQRDKSPEHFGAELGPWQNMR